MIKLFLNIDNTVVNHLTRPMEKDYFSLIWIWKMFRRNRNQTAAHAQKGVKCPLTSTLLGHGLGLLFTKTLQVFLARGILNSTIRPKPSCIRDSVATVYSVWAIECADLFGMFEWAVRHHGALGEEDVVSDCLSGWLFYGLVASSVGYFFKKLKKNVVVKLCVQ